MTVFRTAKWYRIFSACAALAFCGVGAIFLIKNTAAWQPIAGVVMIAFGVVGFLDVLVSRIVLDDAAIHVISLFRTQSHRRSDFESAKVDGGAVCLKRRDGGWLILPSTGANALSMRNTIDAWIKRK